MNTLQYLLTLVVTVSMTSSVITIERAPVRQGPGAFYPVVAELRRGADITVKSSDEGWVQIEAGRVSGYISSRATDLSAGSRSSELRRPSSGRTVDMSVTSTGVSAAVRGFSNQYANKMNVPQSTIRELETRTFDYNKYLAFKEATYRETRARTYRRNYSLPALPNEMLYYPVDERGAGFAIAGSLASKGLYRNAAVEEYVTFVGYQIAEASHGYDLGFEFLILDLPEREAYSTPGGFVFITKGMLLSLRNEAQLAGILAHEIAHVTMRHGLKEMDNRRNVLAADDAFGELDSEIDRTDEEQQTIDSLNDDLLTYRDRMYSMRIQDFEKAADKMALFYMSRAGYTPRELLNGVIRLGEDIPAGAPVYKRNELDNRRDALIQEMMDVSWRRNLMTQESRFLEIQRRIR